MREDRLTNEELARALAEYLRREQQKKDMYLKKIDKDLTKDYLILNNEINNIYINYDYKINKINKIKDYDEPNDYLDVPTVQRQVNRTLYSGPTPAEQETARTKFLQDDTRILERNTSDFLRRDPSVILASISRNIHSIVYAYNINDEVKQAAIVEAKRQGYVFHADTPLFMLQNAELIKQSAEKDINTINFVPNQAWTSELASFVYQLALKNGYVLTSDSPRFLRSNVEIIKQTLRLDVNSGINIIWDRLQPEELIAIERYIVENQLDYIINFKSPINFKRNIDICITSAKNDPNSVSYFDWRYIGKNEEAEKRIVDALVEQNYVLNYSSPDNLKNNTKICLNSAKNDLHSARYFSEDIQYWLTENLEEFPIKNEEDRNIKDRLYEIRHFLIENGFYSSEQIFKFSASLLNDEFVLDYYLKQVGIPKESKDEKTKVFYDRLKDFIKTTLSTSLKVSDARKVFQMVAQKKWEEYRRENNDYYTNIFNRICDSLEKNNNFISALNELKFLMKIDDVLDERKYALFNAFIEYHQIYHSSQAENKMELLQAKRDDISKNAALFISKSKEDFISEQMAQFDEQYKKFFIIRIDNPIIKKKVVEIKQRDMLKKLFNSQDADLMQKLGTIKGKYLAYNYNASVSKDKIPQILDLFISQSINSNVSSVDDILSSSKPARFDEYENYEKVSKLINRLNSHNITFGGQEVSKYREFIVFDGEKYVYKGNGFSETELAQILGYKDLKYVFSKIKSEIIQIAKGIDNFDNLTQDDIKSVIGECPFTDEYYQFDPNIFNRYYLRVFNTYIETFDETKEALLSDTNYKAVQELANTSGLLQLSMISELGYHNSHSSQFSDIQKYVSDTELSNALANIPSLMSLLTPEEFTIDNLDKILDFKDMFKYADLKQISLLGKDVIKKIYSNNGFTSSSQAERINVACDLVSAMVSRKESTVPYINGTYRNYRYSMYDSTDETLLTTGLDTNACFRVCGNDNDFLHYCALDKNGFVIKLTDSEGNFIGRASGFRNGNGVYINQLRTIYDKKSSAYSSERDAIIKTFEQACNDIVETSQNNPNEETKIDFVVVTRSYTLDETSSNVDGRTTDKIGNNPMETDSEDWKQFRATTKNLREAARLDYFTTDFGNYSIICMKSAVGELAPEKIKKGDVPALYPRTRKQVTVNEPNETIENDINKIKACYSHQTGKDFSYVKVPQGCKIVTGDNWYIVFGNQGILDSCYLSNDQLAEMEFNTVMGQLMINQQTVEENVEDISVPRAKK